MNVRLLNPAKPDTVPTDGVLQIRYEGTWLPVNYYSFPSTALNVVCRQIGIESLSL